MGFAGRLLSTSKTYEAAFETVIEKYLLVNGYVAVARDGFDRDQAIFPSVILDFIRETKPKDWVKLEALPGELTGRHFRLNPQVVVNRGTCYCALTNRPKRPRHPNEWRGRRTHPGMFRGSLP